MFECWVLNDGKYSKVDYDIWYEKANGSIKRDIDFSKVPEFDRYGTLFRVRSIDDIIDYYKVYCKRYANIIMSESVSEELYASIHGNKTLMNDYSKNKKSAESIISEFAEYWKSPRFFNWTTMPNNDICEVDGYIYAEPTTGVCTYITREAFGWVKNLMNYET